MFFVIMSHTKAPLEYTSFCRPFFLTCFFVLSGFFLLNPQKEFCLRKKSISIFFSLFLPYILWWFVTTAVENILVGNYNFWGDFVCSLLYGRKIWFISVLICAELLVSLALTFVPKQCYIALPFAFLNIYLLLPQIQIWYFDVSFFASFYLCIGVLLRLHWDSFSLLIDNMVVRWSVVLISVLLYVSDLLFIHTFFV